MRQKVNPSKSFNWGTGITIVIILFICSTLGMVWFAVSQDYYLVAENHYERAENYQEHIERVQQTEVLENPIRIEYSRSDQSIKVHFPETVVEPNLAGTVEFYRPNDSALDQTYDLNLNENLVHVIPINDLPGGKWLVKVSWTSGQQQFYEQASLFLD